MAMAQGYGGVLTATTAAQLLEFDATAVRISLFNRGPDRLAWAVNCTAAELDAWYGAGNALCLEAGQPFEFEGDAGGIDSIAYRVYGATGSAIANLFAQGPQFDRDTAGLRTLSDVIPLMFASLPGCSDALMMQTVRDVWREFCQRTGIWQVKLTADLVAGTTRYALTLPDHSELVKIRKVWLRSAAEVTAEEDGMELDPSAQTEIEQDSNGIPTVRLRGVIPSEAVTYGMAVRVSLAPLPITVGGSDTMPDAFTAWSIPVVAGAIARLVALPKRPWSSPDLFALNQAVYRDGINRALGVAVRGRGAGSHAISV